MFKRVGEGRPYPERGLTSKAWAAVPPRQVRLDELVTTEGHPAARGAAGRGLRRSTATCSRHVVEWEGEYYLEDGLHRALRRRCTSATYCTPRYKVA